MDVARAGADAVATDVGVVDGRAEERDHAIALEHRRHDRNVEEVAGRQPRIVGYQDVAGLETLGRKLLDEMPARRDRLRDHPAFTVQPRGGQVARLAHHRAERDALQGAGLLADHADQVGPQDLELYSVHYQTPRLATMQPRVSTVAFHPGNRTMVVSRSSMMAGPAIA